MFHIDPVIVAAFIGLIGVGLGIHSATQTKKAADTTARNESLFKYSTQINRDQREYIAFRQREWDAEKKSLNEKIVELQKANTHLQQTVAELSTSLAEYGRSLQGVMEEMNKSHSKVA